MVNHQDSSRTTDGRKRFSVSTAAETDRPTGITILSILHFIGGILMFGLPILTFSTLGSTSAATSILGIPPILLLLGILFLAALGTASGIGMWIGHKWGWWVSSFYYVYGIFRNGAAIATVIAMSDALEGESRGLGFYLVKFGGRIVIHFLILLYLFSENVLGYFDLCDLDKWKAIGTLVAVCLGIVSVIHVFAGIE